MKIPDLDQYVPLERGEAFLASWAIGRYLGKAITREQYQQRLYWQEALSLAPLEQLRRRLLKRHDAEQLQPRRAPKRGHRPKPRLFRVSYAELVALRECQGSIQAIINSLELVTVLGKFHQQSTALESFIYFSQY